MGLILKQGPDGYNSAHDDIWFVVDSTMKSAQNFKYVFDVYVQNQKASTVKLWPEPGTGWGVLNVGRIVRSYLDYNYFRTPSTGIFTYVNYWGFHQVDFYVRFGEEYGSPLTTYPNQLLSATYKALNYYNDVFPAGAFQQIQSYMGLPLTNRPADGRVTLQDSGSFYLWNPEQRGISLEVRAYGANGVQLSSYQRTVADPFGVVAYGPKDLNMIGSLVPYNTAFYTLTIGGSTYTFRVECAGRYPNYTLAFLNRLGGWETMQFWTKSSRSLDIERKTYGGQRSRVWTSNGPGGVTRFENVAGQYVMMPSQRTYHQNQTQKMKLSTDFLSDRGFEWVRELVCSPMVYLRQERSGIAYWIPVGVTNTSFELKTRAANGLQMAEIELEILDEYVTQ